MTDITRQHYHPGRGREMRRKSVQTHENDVQMLAQTDEGGVEATAPDQPIVIAAPSAPVVVGRL